MIDEIIIVDFGSQYTHLITKNLRNLKIYSSITNTIPKIIKNNVKGIILSGGPGYVEDIIEYDLDTINVPILGICFGAQYIAKCYQLEVKKQTQSEYGQTKINIIENEIFNQIFNTTKQLNVWMSHSDSIIANIYNIDILSLSENGSIAAYQVKEKPIY